MYTCLHRHRVFFYEVCNGWQQPDGGESDQPHLDPLHNQSAPRGIFMRLVCCCCLSIQHHELDWGHGQPAGCQLVHVVVCKQGGKTLFFFFKLVMSSSRATSPAKLISGMCPNLQALVDHLSEQLVGPQTTFTFSNHLLAGFHFPSCLFILSECPVLAASGALCCSLLFCLLSSSCCLSCWPWPLVATAQTDVIFLQNGFFFLQSVVWFVRCVYCPVTFAPTVNWATSLWKCWLLGIISNTLIHIHFFLCLMWD